MEKNFLGHEKCRRNVSCSCPQKQKEGSTGKPARCGFCYSSSANHEGHIQSDCPRTTEAPSSHLLNSNGFPQLRAQSAMDSSCIVSLLSTDHMYALPSRKRKIDEPQAETSVQPNLSILPSLQQLCLDVPISKKAKLRDVVCPFCNTRLSSRGSMNRHKKKFHSDQMIEEHQPYKHCCDRCPNFRYKTRQELISHCQSCHHENVQILFAVFGTEQAFHDWKGRIENLHSARYTQNHGVSVGAHYSLTVYHCDRQGVIRRISNPKRIRRSRKTGSMCTSYIAARKSHKSGKVRVEYCLHHVPHSVELTHLQISNDLKKIIEGKLTQGAEMMEILDDIRDNITSMKRDPMVITRRTYNINNQYNISQIQRHASDCQSVELWVHDLVGRSKNPVIFYKALGTSHGILHGSDFLLCLQTPFQKEMMKRLSSKVIYVDSTSSATHDDFILTTVLVVDDCEEAVPVAWAISNRDDAEVIQVFLKALKETSDQDFPTNIFMSEAESASYNAWCEVFSKPENRKYCCQSVEEKWRKKICQVIPSNQTKCETYAFLKILQTDKKKSIFRKQLQDFLIYLKEMASPFSDYFCKHYVVDDKCSLWAMCFQTGSLKNAKMYTEAFHNILRDIHFNREQNRRTDSLLVVLLKLARDKEVEHLIKLKRDNMRHLLQEIRNGHRDGAVLTGTVEITDSNGEWCLPSQTISGLQYSVKKVTSHDICHCELVCSTCNVCTHMYTCTCPEFLTHAIMCRHIHAVHMLAGLTDVQLDGAYTYDQDESDDLHLTSSVFSEDTCDATECDEADSMRTEALKKLNCVADILKTTTDIATIHAVSERLNDILNIEKGIQMKDTEPNFQVHHTSATTQNMTVSRKNLL